jgi:hypothetical protein
MLARELEAGKEDKKKSTVPVTTKVTTTPAPTTLNTLDFSDATSLPQLGKELQARDGKEEKKKTKSAVAATTKVTAT